MATDRRLFWRSGTARVWVELTQSGTEGVVGEVLVFHGEDSAYLGEPGHSYEYQVTVRSDQFGKLRMALGAQPHADVVDLVCRHVEEIMAVGERSWLDARGVERGFHCH